MKKIIIVFSLIIIIKNVKSCDICACNLSGNSVNSVVPQFSKNIIGFRYINSSFNHPKSELNSYNGNQVKKDVYETYEIWGRNIIKNKFLVSYSLPFKKNLRQYENGSENIIGIGDFSAQANYIIKNTSDSFSKKIKFIWTTGFGLKLPNGKYQQRNKDKTMHPAGFQIGTGAHSYSIINFLALKFKNIGFNLSQTNIFNTENELSFQFGDIHLFQVGTYKWIKLPKNITLLPQINYHFEYFNRDVNYERIVSNSGGKFHLLTFSNDVYYKKIMFNFGITSGLKQLTNAYVPSLGTRFNSALFLFF